jgi:hypothetical protein
MCAEPGPYRKLADYLATHSNLTFSEGSRQMQIGTHGQIDNEFIKSNAYAIDNPRSRFGAHSQSSTCSSNPSETSALR